MPLPATVTARASRRSLAPARFDYYHPIVGPELGLLKPPTPGGTTGGGGPTVNPLPETVVPEPSTILIAAVMVGSAFGWGLRTRRLG